MMDRIRVNIIGHWTGAEVLVPVADVYYNNFSEEVGDSTADEIARHLLQGLMTKVLNSESVRKRSPKEEPSDIEIEDDIAEYYKSKSDVGESVKLATGRGMARYGS